MLLADEEPEVVLAPLLDVVELLPALLSVDELLPVLLGARFAVACFARAAKLARVRVAFFAGLSEYFC